MCQHAHHIEEERLGLVSMEEAAQRFQAILLFLIIMWLLITWSTFGESISFLPGSHKTYKTIMPEPISVATFVTVAGIFIERVFKWSSKIVKSDCWGVHIEREPNPRHSKQEMPTVIIAEVQPE